MESLLDTVAQRVENEVGRDFMRKVISLLIASSHFGITELRLSKLVNNEEEEKNSSSHMNTFVFLNGLEVFLEHTGTHIQLKSGIYHDILKCKNDMALLKLYNTYLVRFFILIYFHFFTAKYSSDSRLISEAHRSLADLYQAEYNKCNLVNNQIDPFILEILPYHLSVLNDLKLLEETLCHLKFLQACALHPSQLMNLQLHLNGVYLTSQTHKFRFLNSPKVKAYSAFLQKNQDVLINQPCLTGEQTKL